jgi:hypothetical protein
VELAVTDLTGVEAEGRGTELHRRVAIEDARPFDLERAPLWRAHLFRLDARRSELAVTFDHLICDGTAAYVFLDELRTAYASFQRSRPPSLPPLEIQPADYALWEASHVTEDVLEAQAAWWASALHALPLGPAVPFDHLPDAPTRRIGFRSVATGAPTRRRLQALARRTGSTVFVIAAAAFVSMLGQYGQVDDIVLSTTLSGRARPELDGLIGMFSGIGRIRVDLSGEPTFDEVIERTRRFVLGMYENQDVPFIQVRRQVLPDFPTDGVALAAALPVELQYFRTARSHRTPGAAFVDRPGRDAPDQELFFRGQLHPLSLTLLDDGTELSGTFSFKRDYYDANTVDLLAVRLERVLTGLTTG